MQSFNLASTALLRRGPLARIDQNHALRDRRRPASLGMTSLVPHMACEIAMSATSGDQQ
jgi:hypothetical protein